MDFMVVDERGGEAIPTEQRALGAKSGPRGLPMRGACREQWIGHQFGRNLRALKIIVKPVGGALFVSSNWEVLPGWNLSSFFG